MKLVIGVLLVLLLTGSAQTKGQSGAPPPVFTPATGASTSPELTEDPGNEGQQTRNPAGRDETSAETSTLPLTEGTVRPETATVLQTHVLTTSSAALTPQHTDVPVVVTAHRGAPSPSAAAHSLSSTPPAPSTTPLQQISTTEGGALLTGESLTTFSSQPAHTSQDESSAAPASTTQPQPESSTTQTTGRPETSAPGRAPAGPTHPDAPSELNVGDEDLKRTRHRSSSPLDPLLAGLLSVFIITTAIVFVALFLKFRQRTNHPEFHRLQDLPMDDLMEDTPLSRYSY